LLMPRDQTNLFPYTTLFRSHRLVGAEARGNGVHRQGVGENQAAETEFATQEVRGDCGRERSRDARSLFKLGKADVPGHHRVHARDRKSTRLNSSHEWISYAV